jgi:hypothetical protein
MFDGLVPMFIALRKILKSPKGSGARRLNSAALGCAGCFKGGGVENASEPAARHEANTTSDRVCTTGVIMESEEGCQEAGSEHFTT